jgi:hypothetical protein
MSTPDRILRAKAQDRDPSHFALTERQRQRHERVVTISQYLIADEGRHNINFGCLAKALRMSNAALSFHFVDIEALLADIVRRRLRLLSAALGKYEPTDPNRHQKRRAAYLAYTRTPLAGPGNTPEHILHLLDSPCLDPSDIEAHLGVPVVQAQRPRPQPANPPEPPPEPEESNTWDNPGSGEKLGNWIFTCGIPTQARSQ